MRIRAIGPAVVKDMLEYVGGRTEGPEDPNSLEYLAEAFLLYGVPQVDGLAQNHIFDLYRHLILLFGDVVTARAKILKRVRDLYPHIHDWPKIE